MNARPDLPSLLAFDLDGTLLGPHLYVTDPDAPYVQTEARHSEQEVIVLDSLTGVPAPVTKVLCAAPPEELVEVAGATAGLGVVMGNAVPAAREAADVVIGDHSTDAIATVLRQRYGIVVTNSVGAAR